MSFLPELDRSYLKDKHYRYQEVVANGKKGVIFNSFLLPEGKYDNEKVDLLVLLPQGYPDIPPDMFYLSPVVKLRPDLKFAKATEVNIEFDGKHWQRWSRHFPKEDWRPSIDGIHTYLKKIEKALKVAVAA